MTQRDRVDRIRSEWLAERPDLDTSPQELVGRLHRVAQALTPRLVEVYQRYGLAEGEFDLLCALRRAGPPYQRQPAELARSTMVTTGGLTKRVDRLERLGLVTRSAAGDADRRAKVVGLTEAGRALIDEAFTAHMANEQELVGALSARDRASLERILRGWLIALEGPA